MAEPLPRTKFTDTSVHIYAWPSRGGVIILDDADAIDFEFLGLDPLDPPLTATLTDPTHGPGGGGGASEDEDAFSRRLLLLGAKWWDSSERYDLIAELERVALHGGRLNHFFDEKVKQGAPPPTMREKRFVKVGWPSASAPTGTGGLWISEFDTTFAGVDEEDNLLPDDEGAARLKMARTMDERCVILKERFMARFYERVEDYDVGGYAFLRSWEWKRTGEVGPLMEVRADGTDIGH